MYQKLKVEAWNDLTTHQSKLTTHKSVATPQIIIAELDKEKNNEKNERKFDQ